MSSQFDNEEKRELKVCRASLVVSEKSSREQLKLIITTTFTFFTKHATFSSTLFIPLLTIQASFQDTSAIIQLQHLVPPD